MKQLYLVVLSLVLMTQMSHSLEASSKQRNIVETAQSAKQFKILLAALEQADLAKVLGSAGPFTVLAPNDQAFGKLASGTLESLLEEKNRAKLISILKAHVISGKVDARQLAVKEDLVNLEGQLMPVVFNKGQLNVSGVNVIATDIKASNGVIHIIDSVILPAMKLSTEAKMRQLIELAIAEGVPLYNKGERQACAALYELCAKSLDYLNDGQLSEKLAKQVKEALNKVAASDDANSNAWLLRGVLDKIYASLPVSLALNTTQSQVDGFKPIIEAELPAGFPAPGPVNKVVLKQYPAYRSAKLEATNGQSLSFMKLFSHIKSKGIAMTAPVEMGMDRETAERNSMAFLYANQKIGQTGMQATGVDVADESAQNYLSIGMRGRESKQLIKAAIKKLDTWIEQNPSYEQVGKLRLLGYNSPMIPASKRFWEVQIAVVKKL